MPAPGRLQPHRRAGGRCRRCVERRSAREATLPRLSFKRQGVCPASRHPLRTAPRAHWAGQARESGTGTAAWSGASLGLAAGPARPELARIQTRLLGAAAARARLLPLATAMPPAAPGAPARAGPPGPTACLRRWIRLHPSRIMPHTARTRARAARRARCRGSRAQNSRSGARAAPLRAARRVTDACTCRKHGAWHATDERAGPDVREQRRHDERRRHPARGACSRSGYLLSPLRQA